ncbi:hypothetical protein ACUY2S_06655, partial [Corynebacterium parakroppenstedtii]
QDAQPSTTTLSTPTTPTQSAFKKAKSNPRDTPSQTHILTLNPQVKLCGVFPQNDDPVVPAMSSAVTINGGTDWYATGPDPRKSPYGDSHSPYEDGHTRHCHGEENHGPPLPLRPSTARHARRSLT